MNDEIPHELLRLGADRVCAALMIYLPADVARERANNVAQALTDPTVDAEKAVVAALSSADRVCAALIDADTAVVAALSSEHDLFASWEAHAAAIAVARDAWIRTMEEHSLVLEAETEDADADEEAPECEGCGGALDGDDARFCEACLSIDCPDCGGSGGGWDENRCPRCKGSGIDPAKRHYDDDADY